MATSETVEIPYINGLIRRADNFFWIATRVSTPSLPGKSPEVWKLAMVTAQEGYDYNLMVREAARDLLKGNSDTAKANGKTLEVILKSSSLRVPVCLKISADANYRFARAGYDKNTGTMDEAATAHMTAAAINYQQAYSEYAALNNSLQQSLPPDFPVEVLGLRFRAHYLLASSAYYRAERAQKLIGGKADKESRADYHALLDEAAQNFDASLHVMYIAKDSGLAMPPVTAKVARGVADDLRRLTERYGKTAASHAGTSDWITGVLHVIRTSE